MAVADAFDAMTSSRSYRRNLSDEYATNTLRQGADKQWDGEVVAAFFEALPEILMIRENYQQAQPQDRPRKVSGSLSNEQGGATLLS